MSDSSGTSRPLAPPQPGTRPPLRRPREGRVVAGVAAGIAEHLNLDVAIVRLLIVVATVVTSGFGLLVYIAAIFVIPEAAEGETPPPTGKPTARGASSSAASGAAVGAAATSREEGGRDASFWIGVALLVIGALWILSALVGSARLFPAWTPGWRFSPSLYLRDLLWPLVLIGFGLALWRAGDRRGAPPAQVSSGSAPPPSSPYGPPHDPALEAVKWPAASGPSGGASGVATDSGGAAAGADVVGGAVSDQAAEVAPSTPDAGEPVAEYGAPDASEAGPGPTEPDYPGPVPDAAAAFTDPSATARLPVDPGTGYPPPGVPPTAGDTQASGDGGASWTPPERPRRSLLTRLTLGAMLLTVGVLWMLRLTDGARFGPSRIVAAALLVVGVGLLIGTWFGRGRWLILVGWILLPAVIAAELLRPYGVIDMPDADVRAGFGEVRVTPASLDELESSYQLAAGSISLDLRELEIDEPTSLTLSVIAGELLVYLPRDVTADVTGRVAVGELNVDGRTSAGVGVPRRQQRVEGGAGSELLTLETNVGFGQVFVSTPMFDEAFPDDQAFSDDEAWFEDAALPGADGLSNDWVATVTTHTER